MPKLVVCKWVWYRLTAPENSSRLGHMYFPEGSPRRHQDIFMIHPLAKPPPAPPRYSHIDNLDSSICCCCNFSESAAFGGSSSSRRRQWGITPSGHILKRFNTGALISRMAERLLRRTREVCHLSGLECAEDYWREKRKKKSMWRFCLRSNSTWAAYRPRQHLEWDEDWKEEG